MAQRANVALTPVVEPALRMTYEEFLDWLDEDKSAEWVDGEVVMKSPVSDEHALLKSFLLTLVRLFNESHDLGTVLDDPFQMKTAPHLPGRAPDLIFVAKENLHRRERNLLRGPADIAVEIVSPDDPKRDRVDKYGEYEEGGVREYWLLDQPRRTAYFYTLGEDGRYHGMPIDEDGVFRSQVLPGFWLKVEWLWQEPHPRALGILREWGLI